MKKIQPLKGTKDYLFPEARKRQFVIQKLIKVFEKYGFEPIETPAIEYWEILSGKYGEEEKLIYKFKDLGGRDVGLRYDLTVPLARVVATYQQLPRPFKRYQVQTVWRAEKPQRGRLREFTQCDIDIAGVKEKIADAEIIALIYDALKEFNFTDFIILINSRKILMGLSETLSLKEKEKEICRAIDKFDKGGFETVEKSLQKYEIPEEKSREILKFLEESVKTQNNEDALNFADEFISAEIGKEGIKELRELLSYLEDFEIPKDFYTISLRLARGLDYYTGPIFEVVSKDVKIGSILGGGRFDNLIGIFAGRDIPAVGASFGLERLCEVFEELGLLKDVPATHTKVLVAHKDALKEAVKLVKMLREKGINSEVYYEGDFRGALHYANQKGINFVILLGEDEIKEGYYTLKIMDKREQIRINSFQELMQIL